MDGRVVRTTPGVMPRFLLISGSGVFSMNVIFLVASLLFAMGANAQSLPTLTVARNVHVERFYGFVYALGSNRYLYTEVNERRYTGDRWIGGTTLYYAPDGRRLGSEVLEFSASRFIPLYRLEVADTQYADGVSRVTARAVHVFRKRNRTARLRRAKINRTDNLVAGAGLQNFIRRHFVALSGGRRMKIRLVEPGRLRAFSYTISRLRSGICGGEKVVRFKVDRSSVLRFWAGHPMIFDVMPASRRICQYRGMSDLRNPKTGQPYRVRIDYSKRPPVGVPKDLPPLLGSS